MKDFKSEIIKLFGERAKFNESLSEYTTFKIGGPADYFIEVKTDKELVKLVKFVKLAKIPFLIIGGGSNILVADSGFRGLVIKNKIEGIRILGFTGEKRNGIWRENSGVIEVESGTMMNHLVRWTIEEELEGIEEFLGLPGTVGGAVACNSHWQGKKINDYILEVIKIGGIISKVILRLKKTKDKKELWRKAEEALFYRKKTQPLNYPSAGCIFKNISLTEAKKIKTPNLTCSAGYLIDQCGLKGKKVGEAQVSEKHANFIINLGHAKASDVIELINIIKIEVFKKFGIELREEIKYLGF